MFRSTQTPDDSPLPDEAIIEEALSMDDMIDDMGDEETIEFDPETGEIVVTEEVNAMIDVIPFASNLAEVLNEEELEEIGSDIYEKVQQDIDSRKQWYDTLKKGMKALGIYAPDDDADTNPRKPLFANED